LLKPHARQSILTGKFGLSNHSLENAYTYKGINRHESTVDLETLRWFLYTIIVEFHEAYLVIVEDKSQRHDLMGMKNYLLCHALELTLKGRLVDTGKYDEEKEYPS
jgi:hypothetical protein